MRDLLESLLRVGTADGPSTEEALQSFAGLRSTPDESRAVQRLLAREASFPLPEPLLLALASALVDRGESDVAAAVLTRAASPAGLMMRADLLEGAGERASALGLVEQVLGRDVDWPGARERQIRWRSMLGRSPPQTGPWLGDVGGAATTIAALGPQGPFSLVREVGRGGSGTVYEAEDRDLGRRIALKLYHHPVRDRAKLLHEARVAAAVAGDGIVPVFDLDPDGGWLAMQWAPFGALASPARSGDAGAWIRPLARALAHVHSAGWVHNDLKPANVLLKAPGSPMLADFGIARRIGEPSPPGSPGYVSPERLARRTSDPSDDVFGFGRVLLAEAKHAAARPDVLGTLAAECTGPIATRPRDGHELVQRIEALCRP